MYEVLSFFTELNMYKLRAVFKDPSSQISEETILSIVGPHRKCEYLELKGKCKLCAKNVDDVLWFFSLNSTCFDIDHLPKTCSVQAPPKNILKPS